VNLSDQAKPDPIGMATDRRTRFQRFRPGSVAGEVVAHAAWPVFLVRARQG
jgi:nucleotide-binding universal stress UspA family protein